MTQITGGQKVSLGALLVLVGAGVTAIAAGTTGLVTFEALTTGEVAERLAPLFLVTLFVERALEVFVSGCGI